MSEQQISTDIIQLATDSQLRGKLMVVMRTEFAIVKWTTGPRVRTHKQN